MEAMMTRQRGFYLRGERVLLRPLARERSRRLGAAVDAGTAILLWRLADGAGGESGGGVAG